MIPRVRMNPRVRMIPRVRMNPRVMIPGVRKNPDSGERMHF
jgi:hypothetical protein